MLCNQKYLPAGNFQVYSSACVVVVAGVLNPFIVPTRPTIITMAIIIRGVNLILFINIYVHWAYHLQD